MEDFNLQPWHYFAALATIIAGIVKGEVTNTIKTYIFIRGHQPGKGKKLEIQGPDGSWQAASIKKLNYAVPFIRDGSVLIVYCLDDHQ